MHSIVEAGPGVSLDALALSQHAQGQLDRDPHARMIGLPPRISGSAVMWCRRSSGGSAGSDEQKGTSRPDKQDDAPRQDEPPEAGSPEQKQSQGVKGSSGSKAG
jgi:hypothetical protein